MPAKNSRTVFVEGPYGSLRSLRQFDSVVLLAGGMGATFTIPLLRDIASAWKKEASGENQAIKRLAAIKRIRFVWIIKSRSQLSLFEAQLRSVLADVDECRRMQPGFDKEIDLSIYITCDEKLEPPTTVPPTLPPVIQSMDTRAPFPSDEKKSDLAADHISVHSVAAQSSSTPTPKTIGQGCLPGGGCCCTTQIEDEDEITTCTCTCSGPTPVQTEKATTDTFPSSQAIQGEQKLPPPTFPLTILSGRPHPRSIIRKVLEKAEGESAVVVCGPVGLADDVRRSVVYLSDERAVHKGTGAQGIYLHIENFGW